MKLEIHRADCCGFGECVAVAPEIFGLADDGLVALLVDANVTPEQEGLARQAALGCPTEAIEVHE